MPIFSFLIALGLRIIALLFRIGLGRIGTALLSLVVKWQIWHLGRLTGMSTTGIRSLIRNTYIERLKQLGIPYRVFIRRAPKPLLDTLKFHRLKPNIGRLSKRDREILARARLIRGFSFGRTITLLGITAAVLSPPLLAWVAITQTIDFFVWPKLMSERNRLSREWLKQSERRERKRKLTIKEREEKEIYGITLKEIERLHQIFERAGNTHYIHPRTGEMMELTLENAKIVTRELSELLILEGRIRTRRKDIYELFALFAVDNTPYEERKPKLPEAERKELEKIEAEVGIETPPPVEEIPKEPVIIKRPKKIISKKLVKRFKFLSRIFRTEEETKDNALSSVSVNYEPAKRKVEQIFGYPFIRDVRITKASLPSGTWAKARRRGNLIVINSHVLRRENLSRLREVVLVHELIHCLLFQYGINIAYRFPYQERLHENLAFYLSGEPDKAPILRKAVGTNTLMAQKIGQLWIAKKQAGDSTGKAREHAVLEITGRSWYVWRGVLEPAWVRRLKKRRPSPIPEPEPVKIKPAPEIPEYADVRNPLTNDTLRIPKRLLISGTIIRDPQERRLFRVIIRQGVVSLEVAQDFPVVMKVKEAKVKRKLPEAEPKNIDIKDIQEEMKEKGLPLPELPRREIKEVEEVRLPEKGIERKRILFLRIPSPYTGKPILVPGEWLKPGKVFIDGTSRNRVRVALVNNKWVLKKVFATPIHRPVRPVRKTTPEIRRNIRRIITLRKEEQRIVRPVMRIVREKRRTGRLTFTPTQRERIQKISTRIQNIRKRIEAIKKRIAVLKARRRRR